MTNCIFCNQIQDNAVFYQTKHFKVVLDIDPIQTGHLLLISKEHYTSITQLSADELHDLIETEAYLISMLEETLPIDGVTLASNDKNLMDKGTHFHVHLIPRTSNDGFWNSLNLKNEDFPVNDFLDKLKR
ncbi:HIT family protein [Streptococcus ovis]|uniref:HIT family protein n=1 Tax=Streptococcus ovis TaxID=82806 RepID=UPI00037A4261|nr:HIT family protein [Streptococcus ovis]